MAAQSHGWDGAGWRQGSSGKHLRHLPVSSCATSQPQARLDQFSRWDAPSKVALEQSCRERMGPPPATLGRRGLRLSCHAHWGGGCGHFLARAFPFQGQLRWGGRTALVLRLSCQAWSSCPLVIHTQGFKSQVPAQHCWELRPPADFSVSEEASPYQFQSL